MLITYSLSSSEKSHSSALRAAVGFLLMKGGGRCTVFEKTSVKCPVLLTSTFAVPVHAQWASFDQPTRKSRRNPKRRALVEGIKRVMIVDLVLKLCNAATY